MQDDSTSTTLDADLTLKSLATTLIDASLDHMTIFQR